MVVTFVLLSFQLRRAVLEQTTTTTTTQNDAGNYPQTSHIISKPLVQPAFDSNIETQVVSTNDYNNNNNNNNNNKALFNKTGLPAVLYFPSYFDGEMHLKIETDGLNSSQGLDWIHDVKASMLYPNVSWLGSTRPNRPCNDQFVREAIEFYQSQRAQKNRRHRHHRRRNNKSKEISSIINNRNKVKPDWTIHISDWYDFPNMLLRCVRLEKLVGFDKFRYWKRSIVQGRRWNNMTQSIELGHVVSNISGAPVHFLAYPVRTDLVDAIQVYVQQKIQQQQQQQQQQPNLFTTTTSMMTNRALTDYLVSKDRPGDVAHFWPVAGGPVDRGSRFGSNSELRTKTSETLLRMTLPPYNLSQVFCHVQGSTGKKGRKSVSDDYVESMLHYKIIVVAQRDNWEGHWRMFEAMISGAMVIHDRMLAVPLGLEENVNIVLYDSLNDLKDKVMYYLTHSEERLRIARLGRQVAMCYHRSWHRMEQIVLGRTVTPCYE